MDANDFQFFVRGIFGFLLAGIIVSLSIVDWKKMIEELGAPSD